MDISVVIPLFNTEKYIEECIHALIGQDYPIDRYEIIMVDNNSTDGTTETVRQYSNIKLLYEAKQGAYCARNKGIQAASGDLIAFTDPDCSPNPDWLSRLAIAASSLGGEIILGKREYGFRSYLLSMLTDYESVKAKHVFSSDTREIYYGYTNNMAVHKSLFDKLGHFVEVKRGADTVFVRKAVEMYGCQIVQYSPDVCVRHLEILNVWDYYSKNLIYGISNELNQSKGSTRPLTNSERVSIYSQTVRSRRYSVVKSYCLFLLLGLGMLCYEFGRRYASMLK